MQGEKALAMLDEAIWGDTGLQEADETTEQNKIKIAGFTVNESKEASKKRLEAAYTERRQRLQGARQLADHLRNELQAQGLSPIAVLPHQIWERLCHEAGLYRFESLDEKSSVWCHEPFSEPFSNAMSFIPQAVSLCLLLACTGGIKAASVGAGMATYALFMIAMLLLNRTNHRGGAYFLFLTVAIGAPGAVAAIVQLKLLHGTSLLSFSPKSFAEAAAGFVASFVGVMAWVALTSQKLETACQQFLAPLLRLIPEKRLHRTLWPRRIDQPAADEDINTMSHARVEISFPTPPEDVARILLRAKELTLSTSVAAVDEAITVNRDSLIAGIQHNIANDPIIYVRHGDLVAVLAQFGEFPLEEATISKISKVEFLS